MKEAEALNDTQEMGGNCHILLSPFNKLLRAQPHPSSRLQTTRINHMNQTFYVLNVSHLSTALFSKNNCPITAVPPNTREAKVQQVLECHSLCIYALSILTQITQNNKKDVLPSPSCNIHFNFYLPYEKVLHLTSFSLEKPWLLLQFFFVTMNYVPFFFFLQSCQLNNQ